MEALSTIISLVLLVVHLITKYGGSSDNSSNYSSQSYLNNETVLSKKEKLEFIYDKELTKCYKAAIVLSFNFNSIENFLKHKNYGFFRIDEVIKVKNCAYITFTFIENYITFDKLNNKVQATRNKTSYFSIHNFYTNQSILIYGLQVKDIEVEKIIFKIADQLINEISK